MLSRMTWVCECQAFVSWFRSRQAIVTLTIAGHSWSPIFGRSNQPRGKTNGDVLISTLEVNNAAKLPNLTSLPGDKFEPDATKLNSVTLLDKVLPGGKRLVRVGTSTTNEQFRRWCKEKGRVTLPMNIIEVEITMGGNNAPIW